MGAPFFWIDQEDRHGQAESEPRITTIGSTVIGAVPPGTIQETQQLYARFPEVTPGLLGGWVTKTEFEILRGLAAMRGVPFQADGRMVGREITVTADRSKMDERVVYQEKLIEAASQSTDGVIVAPGGSGKTAAMALLIEKIGRSTLILCSMTVVADQIRAELNRFCGIEAGTIYGGTRKIKPVTVGLIQSVGPDDPILGQVGCLLIDEAHMTSANGYLAILKKCPAKWRYGLTATIDKSDGTHELIHAALGPVLARLGVRELQDQEFLNRGSVKPVYTTAVASVIQYVTERCSWFKFKPKDAPPKCPTPCSFPQDESVDRCIFVERGGFNGWVCDQLARDEARNDDLLGEIYLASMEHDSILVLTHRAEHVKVIAERLAKMARAPAIHMASGPTHMKPKTSKENIEAYKAKGGVLVATSQMVGVGFNAPKTSCLVRAMPNGGKVAVEQQTARIMRPQEIESLIIDFVDLRIGQLKGYWFARQKIYKKLGFTVLKTKKSDQQGELFAPRS